MGQILVYKKRKGFTILEEAVVIAVIAILAIPLVTLLNQSIQAQIYGTKDIKGQYYANLIMQDFERRVRQANSGSITITTGNPYKVTFTYQQADNDGKNPSTVSYSYEIDDSNTANSLFKRNGQVFPVGLEKGVIKDFKIISQKTDTSQDPPYYIEVKIETSTGTILQKTIYLVNYYKQG